MNGLKERRSTPKSLSSNFCLFNWLPNFQQLSYETEKQYLYTNDYDSGVYFGV